MTPYQTKVIDQMRKLMPASTRSMAHTLQLNPTFLATCLGMVKGTHHIVKWEETSGPPRAVYADGPGTDAVKNTHRTALVSKRAKQHYESLKALGLKVGNSREGGPLAVPEEMDQDIQNLVFAVISKNRYGISRTMIAEQTDHSALMVQACLLYLESKRRIFRTAAGLWQAGSSKSKFKVRARLVRASTAELIQSYVVSTPRTSKEISAVSGVQMTTTNQALKGLAKLGCIKKLPKSKGAGYLYLAIGHTLTTPAHRLPIRLSEALTDVTHRSVHIKDLWPYAI
jgi:hypothetical protein